MIIEISLKLKIDIGNFYALNYLLFAFFVQ